MARAFEGGGGSKWAEPAVTTFLGVLFMLFMLLLLLLQLYYNIALYIYMIICCYDLQLLCILLSLLVF